MTSFAALRAFVALGAVLVLGGVCDTIDLVLVPEVEEAFSFESGLEGWTPAGIDLDDPPVDWDVSLTDVEALEGTRSVRLRLDNMNDAGKIWIERAFQLAPNQAYDVTVRYGFGTSDFGDVNLWRILTGVHLDPPRAPEHLGVQGDTGHDQGQVEGPVWTEKEFTFRSRTGADARLWVSVGVWGTWETERTYYLDEVEVAFTRADEI